MHFIGVPWRIPARCRWSILDRSSLPPVYERQLNALAQVAPGSASAPRGGSSTNRELGWLINPYVY